MKISIVTIVYNDVARIGYTMNSVAAQTMRCNIEYIIVDGASTDGTSDYICEREADVNLYICEPDNGIYDAMNKGLRNATGEYVMFLNCGDSLDANDVIEQVIELIEGQDKTPTMVCGAYREETEGECGPVYPPRSHIWMWYGPITAHLAHFYHLNTLREFGLDYDKTYNIAADYKLSLECCMRSKGNVVTTNLCIGRFETSGVSTQNKDDGLKEANRVRREVLGWRFVREKVLTSVLLTSRNAKCYLGSFYKWMRSL